MENADGHKKDSQKLVQVLLMSEDRGIQLTIGFFGFRQDAIEDYLTKNIIECDKAWTKKYTQMKYV